MRKRDNLDVKHTCVALYRVLELQFQKPYATLCRKLMSSSLFNHFLYLLHNPQHISQQFYFLFLFMSIDSLCMYVPAMEVGAFW
jgi:hypothetical protein